MEIVFASTAALAVGLLVVGLRLGGPDRRARHRVAQLRDETQYGLPAASSPTQARRASRASARVIPVIPPRLAATAESLLGRAGSTISVVTFVLGWFVVSCAGLAFAVSWVATSPDITLTGAMSVVGLVALVVLGPWWWLRRRALLRTRTIDRALPQALDIIVTNIECGLGLQAAMLVVAQRFTGPIALEFARAMREISLGVPREEALTSMARRTGSNDVAGVARAIAQAERSGVSVGDILRARASELRERRRLLAREQANKIPVKMTIPTVLFIFPTFFLLVLGPVALNAIAVMGQE